MSFLIFLVKPSTHFFMCLPQGYLFAVSHFDMSRFPIQKKKKKSTLSNICKYAT